MFRAYAITRLEQLGWKRAAFIVPGAVFTVLHLYQGVIAIARHRRRRRRLHLALQVEAVAAAR